MELHEESINEQDEEIKTNFYLLLQKTYRAVHLNFVIKIPLSFLRVMML